ncbi:hypothetical protein EYR38_010772 [Pleurotus pulmonarius]|nr:hypothetical protein EYR38_010772 [Pleurotus pulmonarius]
MAMSPLRRINTQHKVVLDITQPAHRIHYQLSLYGGSPLIPATIRQSLLEFDTPLTSYKKALTEEGLSFDNLDQRMARLRSELEALPVSVRAQVSSISLAHHSSLSIA